VHILNVLFTNRSPSTKYDWTRSSTFQTREIVIVKHGKEITENVRRSCSVPSSNEPERLWTETAAIRFLDFSDQRLCLDRSLLCPYDKLLVRNYPERTRNGPRRVLSTVNPWVRFNYYYYDGSSMQVKNF